MENLRPCNIFIVGGGKVAEDLISALVKEGNNLTLIDKSEGVIKSLCSQYDIMGFTGNGASYKVLMDAGVEEADVFIALTQSDELNILCCTVASQISNANTIARIRTPDYSEDVWYLRDRLGLTMVINPEFESAGEISRILNLSAARDVNYFAGGEAVMFSVLLEKESKLCGMRMMDYMKSSKEALVFTSVEREGEAIIPHGDFVFREGDVISFVSARRGLIKKLRALDMYSNPLRNCLIVGGGRSAYYLASRLVSAGLEVKIIEKEYERCEELSASLPKCTIIHGDGSDINLLMEEGVMYYDSVVLLTGIDEINIMLSLFLTKKTKAKVISKVSHMNSVEVLDDFKMGSIVNPKRITTDAILTYTRAKRVAGEGELETLYRLFDGRIEVLEFRITKESSVTGVPFKELKFHDNVLVGCIMRKGRIIFPGGGDSIKVGDSVMIVTSNTGYTSIQDILE